MKFIFRIIPSFIAAAAVFAVFFILFEAEILIAAAFGAAAFAGAALIFSKNRIDAELEAKLSSVDGITPALLKEILSTGRKKIRKMIKTADEISDTRVKSQIKKITDLAEKIYLNFEQDPKDIKNARQFINYYLDATLKIISQYADLSKKNSSQNFKDTITKTEELLGIIEKGFEKQLSKLHEDDFLDLDSEIKLLEKSMKFDGLSEKSGR